MTVYADILFLINFFADLVCLAACRRIRGIRVKKRRLCLAAGIGGVYGVAAAISMLPGIALYALSLAAACLICFAAFGRQPLLSFFRTVMLFYIANLLLGGLLSVLDTMLGDTARLPLLLAAVLCLVLYAAMTGISALLRAARVRRDSTVEITLGERKASFTVLADSGNLLHDPYTGAPVILLSQARLRRAFPEEALFDAPLAVPPETLASHGWHIIPADTASGGTLLDVFVPDAVTVNGRRVDAVAASVPSPHFGGAEGLIPSALLVP